MSDETGFMWVGFVLCMLISWYPLYLVGANVGQKSTMDQAYKLNLAKECLGKEGYYFVCEEK
jgi:hypothetical protein